MSDTTECLECGVLVLEDEYFIAQHLERLLTGLGLDVIGPFGTLAKASSYLRAGKLDVAILDIDLPDGSAYALADELHARRIGFAFATGYDQTAIPPRFAGVPCWEKPFNERRLADGLRQLCAERRTHTSATRTGAIRNWAHGAPANHP